MCFDYRKQEFFVFDTKTKKIITLQELQMKDNAKVNFIRNLMEINIGFTKKML